MEIEMSNAGLQGWQMAESGDRPLLSLCALILPGTAQRNPSRKLQKMYADIRRMMREEGRKITYGSCEPQREKNASNCSKKCIGCLASGVEIIRSRAIIIPCSLETILGERLRIKLCTLAFPEIAVFGRVEVFPTYDLEKYFDKINLYIIEKRAARKLTLSHSCWNLIPLIH